MPFKLYVQFAEAEAQGPQDENTEEKKIWQYKWVSELIHLCHTDDDDDDDDDVVVVAAVRYSKVTATKVKFMTVCGENKFLMVLLVKHIHTHL